MKRPTSLWHELSSDFILQACRGNTLDAGIKMKQRRRTELDSSPPLCKIPTHADFLFAYSSVEGKRQFN
jgi:caspase-like apoptosis-related cysteine protease